MPARPSAAERGFSLIEVIITLGILMSLTIAVASMLRSGFEVRQGLSQRAKVVHRLSVAVNKVSTDVQEAFFVSPKDNPKNGLGRRTKGIFKIEKQGSGDRLSLTTKTHQANRAGANESDLTYVVYELRDSKDEAASGRKDLYRGESPYIPEDLKEEPPLRLLARGVKAFTVQTWNGERWMTNDYWDTGRGDSRNRLPRLVKITIEAYAEERVEGELVDERAEATEQIQTVVYVADSWEYGDIKDQVKTIKWDML
jgi:type II secretory pathway component PulJ